MSNTLKNKPIIIKKQGQLPGLTLVIMAGVHGNEKLGVEALKKAINNLSIKAGVVYYIIANPLALARTRRYIDMDLNRAFKNTEKLSPKERVSSEKQLAKQITPYLNKADALLDLHSVSTAPATPFIICEKNGITIARKLPFSIISSGWDKIHPGSTDGYMNVRGKIGICVECGQHKDPRVFERSLLSIKIFLKAMGATKNNEKLNKNTNQQIIQVDYIYRCKKNFNLVREIPDFTPVKRNEIIGIDGKIKIKAPYDGMIILAKKVEKSGSEAFVMGRKIT